MAEALDAKERQKERDEILGELLSLIKTPEANREKIANLVLSLTDGFSDDEAFSTCINMAIRKISEKHGLTLASICLTEMVLEQLLEDNKAIDSLRSTALYIGNEFLSNHNMSTPEFVGSELSISPAANFATYLPDLFRGEKQPIFKDQAIGIFATITRAEPEDSTGREELLSVAGNFDEKGRDSETRVLEIINAPASEFPSNCKILYPPPKTADSVTPEEFVSVLAHS